MQHACRHNMSVQTCTSWIRTNQLLKNTDIFPVKSLIVAFAEGLRLTGTAWFLDSLLSVHRPFLSWHSRLFLPWVKKQACRLQIACNEETLWFALRCSGCGELIASLLVGDCRTSFCVTKLAVLDARFSWLYLPHKPHKSARTGRCKRACLSGGTSNR